MMNRFILLFIFAVSLPVSSEELYRSDIDSYSEITKFVDGIVRDLGRIPSIVCADGPSKSEVKFNTPFCSYKDICESVTRENGYVTLNGFSMPDMQLYEKSALLKQSVMSCYDQLSFDDEGSFASLFYYPKVGTGNDTRPEVDESVLVDILGDEYRRIAWPLTDMDINSVSKKFKKAKPLDTTELESFISGRYSQGVSSDTYYKLKVLNNFLLKPEDLARKDALSSILRSTRNKEVLDKFFIKNTASTRQKLLNKANNLLYKEGFRKLDPKQHTFTSIDRFTANDIQYRTQTIRRRMLAKINGSNVSGKHKKFLLKRMDFVKVNFPDYSDPSCRAGTPAFADFGSINFCPKAFEMSPESLDLVIAHELSHIIDPCSCQTYAEISYEVPRDSSFHRYYGDVLMYDEGNELSPPYLDQLGIKKQLKCFRDNPVLPTRIKYNLEDISRKEVTRACNHYSDESSEEAADQTRETFADLFGLSLVEEDIKRMKKDQAQAYVLGLVFSKPFRCEESKFAENEIYREIDAIQNKLIEYGCNVSKNEVKKYNANDSHFSMEDRVNHILMTKDIQDKLGCYTKKNGRKIYAQETMPCEF